MLCAEKGAAKLKTLFRSRAVFALCAVYACLTALFFAPRLGSSVPVCVFLAAAGALCLFRWRETEAPFRPAEWAAALIPALMLVRRFLNRMDIHNLLGVGRYLVAAAMLPVLVFFFLRCWRKMADISPDKGSVDGAAVRWWEWGILLLSAGAAVTICSKSSPLYPFNDWVDANCFFTVGKAMAHGQVLYRDIYEQKGILLYVLHALAYLISERTFFGVWLLEILAAFFFLFFAYKTARLFAGRGALVFMPLLAGMVYSMNSFCHGDSAEELCLPLLMYAVYLGLRCAAQKSDPSRREWLWIGVTSGCVLWIKFSLLGFYLGWALPFFFRYIRARDRRRFGRMVLWILLGVGVVTAPVLGYFALHRSLPELWTGYFYNNIFLYQRGGERGFLSQLRWSIGDSFQYSPLLYASVLFSLPLFLRRRGGAMAAWVFLPMGGLYLTVYANSVPQFYYSFILNVFSPLVFILPALWLEELISRRSRRWIAGAVCAALGGALIAANCNNLYLLSWQREDMPQYIFDRTISRYEDPTLLNLGFLDGGFYTVSGIVPSEKYFCSLNLGLEDISREHEECLREGRVDFVVTRNWDAEFPLYHCVDMAEMPFEGLDWTYRLYIRNDLAE